VIELVREALHYPQFSTDGRYGGLVSQPPFGGAYTLFQSPSLMNISGKPIKTAWRAFLNDLNSDEREHALLVILHDELEKQVGEVKLKKTGSPAGHNGLISIISQLQTKVAAIPFLSRLPNCAQ
jgi:PTH1 family peptidyl-tRNA hydrolase